MGFDFDVSVKTETIADDTTFTDTVNVSYGNFVADTSDLLPGSFAQSNARFRIRDRLNKTID
jgi:hypothetical protein